MHSFEPRLLAGRVAPAVYRAIVAFDDSVELDERRLATLAGWHESPFFTDRERAALALTDAVTRIADGGVPDDVWATAASHFPDAELAQLLWAIVTINAWNRIGVATRLVPQS
jgi:alkylhydroperoxidase family enzyme